MRSSVLFAAVALAACAPTTTSLPSSGATPTTTTVSSSSSGTVDLTLYADNRASSNIIQAPPDRIWAVMPAVYEGLKIPIGTIDQNTRVIGNRRLESRSGRIAGERVSSYLNCGSTGIGTPVADSYQINLSVLTQVALAAGGVTDLQTSIEATATQRGVSGAPVRCASTGRLEQRVAELASAIQKSTTNPTGP